DQTSSEEFAKWQAQWDAAAAQFAKDTMSQLEATAKVKPTSFFNNAPRDTDYVDTVDTPGLQQYQGMGQSNHNPSTEQEPSWQDIYRRSMDLSNLIVDWDNGEKKPEEHFGAFTPTKTNPTQQSSTGPDASPAPTEPIRVARNYSDGPELRELDELKRKIEEMERKHHEAEVAGKAGMLKELSNLRERIEKLSEKINKEPTVDVT